MYLEDWVNCEETEIWIALQSTEELELTVNSFLTENTMMLLAWELQFNHSMLGCEVCEDKE